MQTVNDYIVAKLTHSIHTSERMSFRACRRRWNWLFHDHLYPTTTPKPLEFGSAFHKAMEAWYEPTTWGKDPETRETLAILAFKNACSAQKTAYLLDNKGNIDPEVEQDFKERVELGVGMLHYHCRKVSPTQDRGFVPLKVEIDFEVPIKSPSGDQLWCKCDNCQTMWRNSDAGRGEYHIWQTNEYAKNERGSQKWQLFHEWPVSYRLEQYQKTWKGLPVTYGGRIDMLAKDEDGRLWIFDWKTAARLSGQEEQESPDEFILLDDQITSYVWGLWVLGVDVAGFVHHEVKKAFPVEPEPNKVMRKGCWYSVNRLQNTSYDIYLDTIREGDPGGFARGAYDEYLDFLKESGVKFYSRKQVHRSETELRNAGYNIYLEACDMIDSELRLYPSPGRYGCNFCAYRQPCIGMNRGEDVDYMLLSNYDKRPHRYWELTPSNTDTKGGT
jgi:PD-(D/E)XK nuclease superfamily protein